MVTIIQSYCLIFLPGFINPLMFAHVTHDPVSMRTFIGQRCFELGYVITHIFLPLHHGLNFEFKRIQSKVMTQSYSILLFGTPCIPMMTNKILKYKNVTMVTKTFTK